MHGIRIQYKGIPSRNLTEFVINQMPYAYIFNFYMYIYADSIEPTLNLNRTIKMFTLMLDGLHS